MKKKMSVKFQMLFSFSILIIFTMVVGGSGKSGIESINKQNQIRSFISSSLVNVQDAQAASLRYVIYGSESYMEELNAHCDRALANVRNAMALSRLEEILADSSKMIEAVEVYKEYNSKYLDFGRNLQNLSDERAEAAAVILSEINEMISLEEKNTRGSFLLPLKEMQSQVYLFHNNAYRYMLAATQDTRDSELSVWLENLNVFRGMAETAATEDISFKQRMSLERIIEHTDMYIEKVEAYTVTLSEQKALMPTIKAMALQVVESGVSASDAVEKSIENLSRQNLIVTLSILAAAMLFGIVIAIIITRSLTRQLGGEPYEIVELTSRIAEGDLNINFPDRELTGVYQSMKHMTARLTQIVNDIVGAADQVTEGSEQISSSSQEISSGTSEQASNMEEVSASIEQLNANIQQNTDNSQQSNFMAKKVAEDSQEGSLAVAETVDAMKNIAEKISVIQEIARSTNMLALNAAIEAARAGDAGKGFAVVASEVRKLAESSGSAAKDITEITESSVHRAIAAQEKIEQIVPAMRKAADLVEEITMASQEQSKGAEQINAAIVQLDTVIQQNASASEELASMSEELFSQASSMKDTISFFKVKNRHLRPAIGYQVQGSDKKSFGAEKHTVRKIAGPDKISEPGYAYTADDAFEEF